MIRSALRAVGYVVSELIPMQAFRCVLDRDYADAMYDAGAKHDGAEQLNEREAEEEVSEPRSVCNQCGKRLGDIAAVSGVVTGTFCSVGCTMAAEDSAEVPRKGPADGPPGLTHSPESPGGHSPDVDWLVPAVTDILAEHHYRLSSEACDCGYKPDGGLDPFDWREHVAPILLQHITTAIAAQPK